MPGGDRTGPIGMGPRTGRGAGFCAGYGTPGYANAPGFGRGRGGRGRGGRGFGFRGRGGPGGGYGPWAATDYPYGPAGDTAFPRGAGGGPAETLETLKAQARHFGDMLERINTRIAEIETSGQGDENA